MIARRDEGRDCKQHRMNAKVPGGREWESGWVGNTTEVQRPVHISSATMG